METIASAGQDQPDGFLAIEFQHTEVGPTHADLPEGPLSLNDYDDLVVWAQRFGVIDEPGARRLRHRARRDPEAATETYELALRIRETLDEVFRSVATGGQPSSAATSALADDEAEALARAKLVRGVNGFAWSWSDDESLGRPLWPVVHDATRLLVDGPLDRVKACGGCRYLFIDESKNRSRRWCDMSTCGTAEKMRRYVERRAARRRIVAKPAAEARPPG